MPDTQDYVLAPMTILIDSREQSPYHFIGYTCDARQSRRPLIIPTKLQGIPTGDYSIEGYESRVAVERKSLEDSFSTFCQGRERFERELARLNAMEFAAIVVEAGWPTVLHSPPPHSKFPPKSYYRSVIAWQVRFPKVHWWFCPTRDFAERTTFRLLQRFWLDDQERKKQEIAA